MKEWKNICVIDNSRWMTDGVVVDRNIIIKYAT